MEGAYNWDFSDIKSGLSKDASDRQYRQLL